MKSTFLAWIFRMPLIRRWSLMYSHKQENIAEHSHQVAVVAHMLAVIRNTVFDGKLSPEKAATLALYHEIAECWTSDVASPVKYSDPSLTREFKKLEVAAEKACLNTLPEALRDYFEPLLVSEKADPIYKDIVKAADIICAYIKALDELRFNNSEFAHVKSNLETKLAPYKSLPEVAYFIDYFLDSCVSTLDDLTSAPLLRK
ncbi:MAG: 5'-deoxynucleotidase [Hahellaceae bacterium]|nr:5'-deoxynucleotidase [Hahellaceae bacterium]MCP5210112.1 5'-deoxynucleotidase [Hahellaceae bacterium]